MNLIYLKVFQSTAKKYLLCFSIGQNRSLILTLRLCRTTLVDASFSWMLDSQLQVPKPTGFNMTYNG